MNKTDVLQVLDDLASKLQQLRSMVEEDAPKERDQKTAAARKTPSHSTGGSWKPRLTFEFNGEQRSINDLAQLAGCSYLVMHTRLKLRTPAEAVAMGAADRSRNAIRKRGVATTEAARATRPAKAEQAGQSEHPLRKLAPGTKLAKIKDDASAKFRGEAFIPNGVKVQVIAPPAPPTVPFTFGRIGEYLPADTHMAKVYGGRR